MAYPGNELCRTLFRRQTVPIAMEIGPCRRSSKVDSMPEIPDERVQRLPSIVSPPLEFLSDDECLERLARAIATHDLDRLDEVAHLIGRLAVTIE